MKAKQSRAEQKTSRVEMAYLCQESVGLKMTAGCENC